MSSASQLPSFVSLFFFPSYFPMVLDSFHDTRQSRWYKSWTPANIWNSNCCKFHFSSGFATLDCTDHVSALVKQHVNMCCAFTHKLFSIRWAHWTQKVGLPLAINLKHPYKTSHPRYRIVLHMFIVAFDPGFTGIEEPKKSYRYSWRDVKKNPDKGKKKGTTKEINHLLCHKTKSATHYQMQSAHMRALVMQRHRLKLFFIFFFPFSSNGRRMINAVWVVSWAANNVTEPVHFILCYYSVQKNKLCQWLPVN